MRKKPLLHIAIDGPVASGKGTVASLVARKLSILYVETGAMYRAAALLAIHNNVDLKDEAAVISLLHKHTISLKASEKNAGRCEIYIDRKNVTNLIRTPEVSRGSSNVAVLPKVRQFMVDKQREIAQTHSVVMEGRDITTVVLPHAKPKIYLTADVIERARRRYEQLKEKDIYQDFKIVLAETKARDKQDMSRKSSPLTIAKDSILIDTTKLTIDQVVDAIIKNISSPI